MLSRGSIVTCHVSRVLPPAASPRLRKPPGRPESRHGAQHSNTRPTSCPAVPAAGPVLSAVLCSDPLVSQSVLPITEKAPTRAFSWLEAPTSALTFKTPLRHWRNYHEGRALRHYANQPARPLWLVLSAAPRSDTDILRNPQTSLACLAEAASAAQIEISNEKRKPSVKRNMGSVYWGGYECYLNLHQFPMTLWLKSSLQNSTK